MMFNTEVIVKDMKGGKEDMTENKRFERNISVQYCTLCDEYWEEAGLNNDYFE